MIAKQFAMTFEFSLTAGRTSRLCFVALLLLALCGGVGSRAFAQSVELTWNPSPDNDIVGYVVYYGTQSGVYSNTYTVYDGTDAVIPNLQSGVTYYFAVAALDVYGIQSELSNVASSVVPYPNPIQLQAEAAPAFQAVELIWYSYYGGDIVAYNVYSGTQSGVYTNCTTCYYETDLIVPGLPPGVTNYFAVTAVDVTGVESALSNEVAYSVPVPVPLVLQRQIYYNGNNQLDFMELSVSAPVSGSWEVDSSTNLLNWTTYTYGYGNGNGYDVDIFVNFDPTQPQMFYRVVNY